jgi:hypothetical protein
MDKHSRFWLHYVFHDARDTGQAFSGRLVGILRERFGDDAQAAFLEVPIPYREGEDAVPSVPLDTEPGPELAPRILLIGIGTGGMVAYNVQRRAGFHGSSLIAFCPPPGIACETSEGPRAIFYGSKSGVYGTSLLRHPLKGEHLPAQMYGLPSLIHGPKLALYAIAYLIGEYMESEDLFRAATGVSGR